MWLPRLQDVVLFHDRMVERSGGETGVRDLGLIESALSRASAAFAGVEAYNGIEAKAAAVCCGLTQNHGFVDGNKRIGVAVMVLILRKNGVKLSVECSELVSLGLSIAQGNASVEDVCAWIKEHEGEPLPEGDA